MNVTFLIGNGFDLNCGLKTRFSDVYEGYCKPSPDDIPLIAKFKKDINFDVDNWGDFEVKMAEYMRTFKTEQDFLICLRDFADYLDKHLKKEEEKILPVLKNQQNSIYKEMVNSVYNFHRGVTHYLDSIVDRSFIPEIILFNYTSAFDKMIINVLNVNNATEHIKHIHGKIGDDSTLGMDNIEQLNNLQFELSDEGKRAFIKSFFNEQFDPARVQWAESTIDDSDIICVFGMTLGESDLRWRKQILEWLLTNENAELFFYKHSCSELPFMRAEQRMSEEEKAKRKILKDWGVSEKDFSYFLKKIHIPCCKNIFNIKPIVENYYSVLEEEKEKFRKRIESNKNRPQENIM